MFGGSSVNEREILQAFETRYLDKIRRSFYHLHRLFRFSTIKEADLSEEDLKLLRDITSHDDSTLIFAIGYSCDDPIQSLVNLLNHNLSDIEAGYKVEDFCVPRSNSFRIFCELYVHVMLEVEPYGVYCTMYHHLLLAMIAYYVDGDGSGLNLIQQRKHGVALYAWTEVAVRGRQRGSSRFGIWITDLDINSPERKILDAYGLEEGGDYEEAYRNLAEQNVTNLMQRTLSEREERSRDERDEADAELALLLGS
jgi:hypothetical protein